jgi:hypothetical protein
MADSQATSFAIQILEGNLGDADKTTTLELVGTMLPFKGARFPTKMRSKTTYYPGNPVGTQQVFGSTKDDTTINGVWYDAALGPGNARALVRQIEYVVEHGFPVEVRWGGGATGDFNDVGITRRGIIKSIDPKWEIAQIVEWSITFEWKGEALQTQTPTFAAGPSAMATKIDEFGFLASSLEETSGEIASWQESIERFISTGTGAMAFVNGTLDDAQSAFANAMTELDYAAGVIQDGAELPASVMERVRGACARVVGTCMNVRAAYDAVAGLWPVAEGLTGQEWIKASMFAGQQAKEAKLALFPTDDPLAQMDGMNQQFGIMQTTDAQAEACVRQAAALAAQIHPLVVAEIRPPAGSDLRDEAFRRWGDPDMWVLIADMNDMDTSEVQAAPTGPSDTGAPPILIPDPTAYAAMMASLWGAEQVNAGG